MKNAIAITLALWMPLIAQDTQWERLNTVRRGEKIWINYSRGDKLQSAKGEFVAWSPENVTVRIKKTDAVLARSDVRKVAVYGGKSRAKGAGIGALIGAGIGAAVYGTAVAASSTDWNVVPPAAIVLGAAALFGGVGALIGLGVGRTKIVPIYESPKP